MEILLIGSNYYGGRAGGCDRGHKKTAVPFSRQHPCCYRAVHYFGTIQKFIGLAVLDGVQATEHSLTPLVGQPEPLQLLGGAHADVSLDQHDLSTNRQGSLPQAILNMRLLEAR